MSDKTKALMQSIGNIPEDIQITAAQIVADWLMHRPSDPFVHEITLAIFAERNRCAALVDANAIETERQASKASTGLVHDAMLIASDVLELTAGAIRDGDAA